MKHDRMQPNVRFQKCARGYLLDVGEGQGMIGTLYAFDNIEGVAAWFLDEYGEPEKADDSYKSAPEQADAA